MCRTLLLRDYTRASLAIRFLLQFGHNPSEVEVVVIPSRDQNSRTVAYLKRQT